MARLDIDVYVDPSGEIQVKKLQQSTDKLETSTKKASAANKTFNTSLVNLAKQTAALYLSYQAVTRSVTEYIKISDEFKQVEGRLKLVTNSTEELYNVQTLLLKSSQDSRTSFTQTADLYARLARSTKTLGVNTEDTLKVTEAISKSITISGASAESANAAIIQLGQGLSSGTLRGEELNSVLEQAPRLAQAIAEGMGITIGKLREFGAAGKLTSEQVFKALLSQAENINEEFTLIPATVSQSITQIGNSFTNLIGKFERVSKGTEQISSTFSELSSSIDDNTFQILFFSDKVVATFSILKNSLELFYGGWKTLNLETQEQLLTIVRNVLWSLRNVNDTFKELALDVNVTLNRVLEEQRQNFQSNISDAKELRDAYKSIGLSYEDFVKSLKDEETTQINISNEREKTAATSEELVESYLKENKELIKLINSTQKYSDTLEKQLEITSGGSGTSGVSNAKRLMIDYYKTVGDTAKAAAITGELAFEEFLPLGVDAAEEMAKKAEESFLSIENGASAMKSSLESSFMDFFDVTSKGFGDLGNLAKSVLQAIIQETIKLAVVRPLVSGIFGGLGLFANGGVFSGGQEVTAFANGGVVSSPTLFPMANGTGLMGEAGPEAIVPLTRIGGDLGVKALPSSTYINIVNESGIPISGRITEELMRPNGDQIKTIMLTLAERDSEIRTAYGV